VSLNVKNPKAHELAAQLSDLTGDSITAVVIAALEAKLREEQQKRSSVTTKDRILAFADRFAQGVDKKHTSADHADLLYGVDGLPR
jgi:antitoxin VapB